MSKKLPIKLFKIVLILLILLICITSMLQENLLYNNQNTYSIYQITNQNIYELKEHDLVLVKKKENIKEEDLILYIDNLKNEKIIKVDTIIKEDNILNLYSNNNLLLEENITGKIIYKFKTLSLISRIISNKIYFVLSIITLITLLTIIEVINITKLNTQKKEEKVLSSSNELLNNPPIKEINKSIKEEDIIQEKTNLDKTIQIPLEELQNEIKNINQKLNTNNILNSNTSSLEDTIIIEDTDDLKKQIEKELSKNKEKN